VTSDDLDAAWGEVHDALPAGWTVGGPSYHADRGMWMLLTYLESLK
jgi:hypothetical protein